MLRYFELMNIKNKLRRQLRRLEYALFSNQELLSNSDLRHGLEFGGN